MQPRTTYRDGGSFSPPNIPATDTLDPLAKRRGSLFVYLSAVLSRLAQELSRYSEEEGHCAPCPHPILPTPKHDEEKHETKHYFPEYVENKKSKRDENADDRSNQRQQHAPICAFFAFTPLRHMRKG